ncbi:zinc transporter ZIP1-like [Procambarus clarkii]|uniref:zinc transporter ZIP1-like n=1 Tax=Procambarus clarkii TaxID=6728 RepID=UPI003744AEE6
MEVDGAKTTALVVLAAGTLLMSLLPLYMRRALTRWVHQDRRQSVMSGCLCFGAGVLIATVFLHLMPETKDTYAYAMDVGYMNPISYPLAELILCFGFFLVFLIEEIIHSCIGLHQERESGAQTTVNESNLENGQETEPRKTSEDTMPNNRKEGKVNVVGEMGLINEATEGTYITRAPESDASAQSAQTTPHANHHVSSFSQSTSILEAVVVVVALSFHSIMEGLAIGLARDATSVWILFSAVGAHKFVIAFSISMELLEVGLSLKPFLASMIIFSLASPIGGFIGYSAQSPSLSSGETGANVLIPNVLQSLAAGTILYVAFCEVLERERAKCKGGWVRFSTLFLGFCVMAGLQCLDKEEQNGGPNTATTVKHITASTVGV